MELNQDALDKAIEAYYSQATIRGCVEAAIKTYLTEITRPSDPIFSEVIVGEPIQPPRDYRKELWTATSVSHTGTAVANVEYCNKVVEGFDKFFREVKL